MSVVKKPRRRDLVTPTRRHSDHSTTLDVKCTPSTIKICWRSEVCRSHQSPRLRTDSSNGKNRWLVLVYLRCLIEVSSGLIPLPDVKSTLAWTWTRCYTPVKPIVTGVAQFVRTRTLPRANRKTCRQPRFAWLRISVQTPPLFGKARSRSSGNTDQGISNCDGGLRPFR